MIGDFTLFCLYFKFGFCSFGDHCRRQHISEVCLETSCDIQNCPRRHPKRCKFYDLYNRCKFGDYCAYAHRENYQVQEINLLKVKVEQLEKVLNEKQNEVEALHEKLDTLENAVKELGERVSTITTPTKIGTKKRRKTKQHPSPCQDDPTKNEGDLNDIAKGGAHHDQVSVVEQDEHVTQKTGIGLRNSNSEKSDEEDDCDSITTEEILSMYDSG